jgi:hypothetical protein
VSDRVAFARLLPFTSCGRKLQEAKRAPTSSPLSGSLSLLAHFHSHPTITSLEPGSCSRHRKQMISRNPLEIRRYSEENSAVCLLGRSLPPEATPIISKASHPLASFSPGGGKRRKYRASPPQGGGSGTYVFLPLRVIGQFSPTEPLL